MLIKVVRFWILTPPFVFDAKSQKHLLAATHIILFYLTINRSLEVGNIAWNPIIQNFQEQWEAPEKRKEDNSPDVPKISKSLPVIKWVEAFEDYCHKAIEAWTIPLVYIIYNPYVFKLFVRQRHLSFLAFHFTCKRRNVWEVSSLRIVAFLCNFLSFSICKSLNSSFGHFLI